MKKNVFLLFFCFLNSLVVFAQELTFKEYLNNKFNQFDTDKDAKLTLKEVKDCKPLLVNFNEYDYNSNQFLTTDEIKLYCLSLFEKEHPDLYKKANKSSVDSLVRVSEINYVKKERFDYERHNALELINMFDVNGNKKIERHEVTKRSFNTVFSRIDVNGDEVLSKKELIKHLTTLK